MKRVTAHVTAAFVIAMLSVTAFATVTAFAYDKPGNPGHHYGEISNPGHHYGQLKHHHTPNPTPSPGPSTNPRSNPGTQHGANGPTVQVTSTKAGAGASTSGSSGVGDPVLSLPSQSQPTGQGAFAKAVSADVLWWLILLVLPALLIVWLIVAAMIGRTLATGRHAQAAPATT